MKVLKFTLSGKHAFFKKPEVNTFYYFTYGMIHKVALLGMLGGILGYKGYGAITKGAKEKLRFGEKEGFPEFYERLQTLKIAIVPLAEKGYIAKKIQIFNNSVGYASKEQGGNLIVKEQWLENPKWKIYILLNQEESEKIGRALQDRTCIYYPYLGKNDHFADITEVEVIEAEEGKRKGTIDSLFLKKQAEFSILEEDEEENWDEIEWFKYQEALPVGLNKKIGMYQTENFVYTNLPLETYEGTIYQVGEKQVAFF